MSLAENMKLSDTMATPIEEKLDQNLKVSEMEEEEQKVDSVSALSVLCFLSLIHAFINQHLQQVRSGMVHVSDGKCRPEPLRLNLTMELLTLQKLEIVTPTSSQHSGPPMESKVC